MGSTALAGRADVGGDGGGETWPRRARRGRCGGSGGINTGGTTAALSFRFSFFLALGADATESGCFACFFGLASRFRSPSGLVWSQPRRLSRFLASSSPRPVDEVPRFGGSITLPPWTVWAASNAWLRRLDLGRARRIEEGQVAIRPGGEQILESHLQAWMIGRTTRTDLELLGILN